MPLISVAKDPEALTMTIVSEFPVPVERLWDAYADPRQLEKFWGPPGWPATFTRHDMSVGGRSAYAMEGPDGEVSRGYWEVLSVDAGKAFEVRDGFAADDGSENTEMPSMRMVFAFEPTDSGSRVTTTTHFPSAEALEQLLGMGMEEGMTLAMGQMDAIITDLASFAIGRATEAQILSDTQVRVSRIIRGSVDDVWRAHHDPELMQRWLLGPDGWSMPECVVATEVGGTYRYWWTPDAGTAAVPPFDQGFGFEGELLESDPPHRAVTTEHLIDSEYPTTTNELTLAAVEGGTLLTLVITYANAEMRDAVLASGMTDGMETSYDRLERELAAAGVSRA